MAEILFVKKQQVIDFLTSRDLEDHVIKWKCPRCGTVNLGAYYSHGSPCGGCNDFVFPRLNLKEIIKDENEATEIAKEIGRYSERIIRKMEIITDLESELSEERSELEDIRDELRELKSCMKKVKEDW